MLFLSILPAPHHCPRAAAATDGEGRLLISEFYPCALLSDEYVAISNAGTTSTVLRNWTVTDGEGSIVIRSNLTILPGSRITITTNSSSFEEAFGRSSELVVGNRTAISTSGTFRLADGGDTIELRRPDGSLADAVAYGESVSSLQGWMGPPIPRIRQGEVAKRSVIAQSLVDTDSMSDWMPFREYRYGFTEAPAFGTKVGAGAVVGFVSPDCSLDVLVSGINSAMESVMLCTYEIGSVPVCDALIDARTRGVTVSVLVDGAPAGGLQEDGLACLSSLSNAGIKVLYVNGNLSEDSVQHVGALHAKYFVVDSARSFVLSENFVSSGLSEDGIYGNRGWGVAIEDLGLAEYLLKVFESDSREDRPDVRDWRMDRRYNRSAVLPERAPMARGQGVQGPLISSEDAWIRVFVSPDASVNEPFLAPLVSSSGEITVQQFQVEVLWDYRWTGARSNPMLDSLITAMRHGASARGLFDSSWYNLEGNKRAVDFLTGVIRNESLQGEFAQLNPLSPISIVHNKGAILDARKTLISSNNWCFASFARNRELAVLVESVEVASYFQSAFEMDWVPDTTPPIADAGFDRSVHPGAEVLLSSNRSLDDRAIARRSWDLGGDGRIECNETTYRLTLDRPGRYRVVLEVLDAWGNSARDVVTIEVVGRSDTGSSIPARGPWWGPCASGAAGAIVGLLLARRRIRAHKVNHRGAT